MGDGFFPPFNCFMLFFPSPLIPSLPSSISTDRHPPSPLLSMSLGFLSLFLFFLAQRGCLLRAAGGILGAGLSSAAS